MPHEQEILSGFTGRLDVTSTTEFGSALWFHVLHADRQSDTQAAMLMSWASEYLLLFFLLRLFFSSPSWSPLWTVDCTDMSLHCQGRGFVASSLEFGTTLLDAVSQHLSAQGLTSSIEWRRIAIPSTDNQSCEPQQVWKDKKEEEFVHGHLSLQSASGSSLTSNLVYKVADMIKGIELCFHAISSTLRWLTYFKAC